MTIKILGKIVMVTILKGTASKIFNANALPSPKR